MCRNKEKAEDITQETFIKAMFSLQDNHTNARAWLYMVARNLLMDTYRKDAKSSTLDELAENDISTDDNTLNSIISSEQKLLLHKAIKKLGRDKQELLILHYFNNVSLKEIAQLLKKTPENIRVQIYRAKRELKTILEEDGYEI